jgi:hypothetical protein
MRKLLLALLILATPAAATPPTPSFTIGDAQANEDSGQLCFPITKHGRINSQPSAVTFYVVAGTAKPVADYTDIRVTVSFGAAAGTKQQCVTLTNDAIPEPAETLTAKIIAGANARLYDGSAVGTILDSDVSPLPPVACPDGTIVLAGQACPPPPPVPTSTWVLKSLWDHATHARAKMDCGPIVGPDGAKQGVVYKLIVGGPGSYPYPGTTSGAWSAWVIPNNGGMFNGWTLENPVAGQPEIRVPESCLEGVVPG